MELNNNQLQKNIYTVSQLTSNIKKLLEESFPFVWVSGEISNFSVPVSGHFYFTLKDESAQIQSVMFRGQNRMLKFEPENGLKITGLGRISVYEPRGSYQLILEHMEPKGIGALQIAFEKMKDRLSKEGLFDKKYKKALPFVPKKICIITSPSGSVLYDFLHIAHRRFPNMPVEIIPVSVQGDQAVKDIVQALDFANSLNCITDRIPPDVIVIARGGGSIEDLFAFNSEDVARSVFVSSIPVVSAIGHETDYTITDFVADLRAPTPSAAAEIVVPKKNDLLAKCLDMSRSLSHQYIKYFEKLRARTEDLSKRLKDPKKSIDDLRLKTDDITIRLVRTFLSYIKEKRLTSDFQSELLYSNNPLKLLEFIGEKHKMLYSNLFRYFKIHLSGKFYKLKETETRLNALNPKGILKKGYSITRTFPGKHVVIDSKHINIGEKLEIIVAKGSFLCHVEEKFNNDRPNI